MISQRNNPHLYHHTIQNKLTKRMGTLAIVSILPFLSFLPLTVVTSAMAEPTVIVNNDAPNNTANSSANNAVNNSPNSTGTNAANTNTNNNTLASQLQPTPSELSEANQQLLSRNAQLQRDVNDLQTQVNVLVNERSGQLYMYGAMTVVAGILVGIFIGWLVFARRERW
ncbi:hypothetical protein [Psychrobacter sp. I-STPA10]|uniref:hypothetical protein n=1 Tax=Psychrobacter sp. I-STPA10 TaxID=2585769 RepID=UPI001E48BA58|nr:hypothetical protein [Psychrobacter sp. I-STPA10]